jgi:small GTP-binding protein
MLTVVPKGQDDYDRLRPLSYPQTDCFIMMYDVACPESFVRLEEKFFPEIKQHCPEASVMLVANKSDLREAENDFDFVPTEDGADLAAREGAFFFTEFSAKDFTNLKEVYEVALCLSLLKQEDMLPGHQSKRGEGCSLQ